MYITSHHIRVDVLDKLVKMYVKKVRESSSDASERMNSELKNESSSMTYQEDAIKVLEKSLEDAKNQLKGIMKLRVAEKIKRPNDTDLIDSLYNEIESDLINRVKGCENQILMLNEQRKALVNSKRLLKTAFDIFDAILQKDQLEKKDLAVVIDKINVYEDHIDIALNPDIDALLHSSSEVEAISEEIVQKATHQKDRHFTVNVIREGEQFRLYRRPLWQPGMRNAAWADKRRL